MTGRRQCSICGRTGHDRRQCGPARTSKPFDPWSDLEWDQHEEARDVVNGHPDGMTLEQVGEVLGVTRERVRQIEAVAMRKLREGINLADTVTMEGVTVAIMICENCDEFYPREGRSKICMKCAAPPKKSRKKIKRAPRNRSKPDPVLDELLRGLDSDDFGD